MVLQYFNTRYPVHQLRDEMDRLLSGFLGSASEQWWPRVGRKQPAVNLFENGDTLVAELEVPGLKQDQLDISVAGGELSIQLQRPDIRQEEVTYHRQERPVGTFTRVLRLPADVDADRVTAELHDGILTISVPKAESAKPRKIEVTSTGRSRSVRPSRPRRSPPSTPTAC